MTILRKQAAASTFLGLAFAALAHAQESPAAAAPAAELHILPVQGGVYMLVGAGGNITVQVGDNGVLLVDSGTAARSAQVLAAVRTLTSKPIRYIINTHAHPAHTGGNEAIGKAGSTIIGGNFAGDVRGQGAAIIAHENVMVRMSAKPAGDAPPLPFAALPTSTYFTADKELFFNGEAIQILHAPAAHTDGDSIVFFRRSDVVATGDVFGTTSYPIIDASMGGSINGFVDALNRVLDLTIPKEKQEGGTYVVPGHGRLCDEADVVEYRDMVTIIRDRVQAMVKKKMTLDQVKAARPTRDYDGRYDTPDWTAAAFVEAVYRSLAPAAAARK